MSSKGFVRQRNINDKYIGTCYMDNLNKGIDLKFNLNKPIEFVIYNIIVSINGLDVLGGDIFNTHFVIKSKDKIIDVSNGNTIIMDINSYEKKFFAVILDKTIIDLNASKDDSEKEFANKINNQLGKVYQEKWNDINDNHTAYVLKYYTLVNYIIQNKKK